MISVDQIKKLRDETGASVMAARKALEASGGDGERAKEILMREFGAIAAKRGERQTRACVIESYIHSNAKIGAMIELCSETDFVSVHEDFKKLAHDLAMQIAASNPETIGDLMKQEFIKSPEITIEDYIKQHIGKFGENITLEKFVRYEV